MCGILRGDPGREDGGKDEDGDEHDSDGGQRIVASYARERDGQGGHVRLRFTYNLVSLI